MKKSSKDAEKDYLSRTIIIEPFQKQELSALARKVQYFQAHVFNIAIEHWLHELYNIIKAGYAVI